MEAVHALVPAAGEGRRFTGSGDASSPIGKLFAPIAGRPALEWTLVALLSEPRIESLTVALQPSLSGGSTDDVDALGRLDRRVRVVAGGADRQESVGLCLASCRARAEDLVVVHDGGRPCLSTEDLGRVIDAAVEHGAAVLGRPMTDTLKRLCSGWIVETLDRSALFCAETPQVVRRRELEAALERARVDGFRATDESGLLESSGLRLRAVEARHPNPKLTVAGDLELIEQILLRHRGVAGSSRRSG
jgi:2-C-methyl-D-erythritol 4-phosphate cytidylyltransferase